jgi:hypothetical protein
MNDHDLSQVAMDLYHGVGVQGISRIYSIAIRVSIMSTLDGENEKHEFFEAGSLLDHWSQLATVPV